jgi:hypothetical protein
VNRYPFAPLAAAMQLSEAHACRVLNLSGSTAVEYRRRGLTRRVADRLAVAAGLHPYEVWPEMVDDDIADTQAAEAARLERKRASARRFAAKMRAQRRADPAAHATYLAEQAAYRARARRAINASRRAYYRNNRERELARQREYDRRRRQEGAA